MKFYMSGEVDGKVGDIFGKLVNEIKPKLKTLEDRDYGGEVDDLGIIPVIIDPRMGLLEKGFFKERRLFKRKAKEADFRLWIDFDKFYNADYEKKKLLILDNIIRSIKILGEKAKKDFDEEKLINDIYNLFDIDENKLKGL